MLRLIFTTLLFGSFSYGQISIDQNDFADAGDTVIISTSNDFGIDFSTTGANSTWDFSYLTAESQKFHKFVGLGNAPFTTQVLFGNFAPQDYSSNYSHDFSGLPLDQFGGALPITFENIVRYTKISADSITLTGYSADINGQTVPFRSDTIETAYKFPLEFNNSYSSRGYSYLDLNPIQDAIYIQHRLRNTEVDGYGSVITPYGTFDALRVHHTIYESDSLYVSFSGFGTWIDLPIPVSHQYEYIAKDEKMPVMKITTQEIQGSEQVSSVEYRDSYQNLDANLAENSIEISIYPNPTSEILNINAEELISGYSIIDASGKVIMNKTVSPSKNIEVKVTTFAKGIYQVVIHTENSISLKSIVVE